MILELGQVWLNAVADPTDCMAFEVVDIKHPAVVNVRTDGYAGGNFRAVQVGGRQRVATVSFDELSDDQAAWLKDHQGTLLWYRDPRGEKFAGIYTDAPLAPRQVPDWWAVDLTVSQVTVSEAV